MIVTPDRSLILSFHDNTDAGAGGLDPFLSRARVVPAGRRSLHPLSEVLRHVIQHCRPNQWGLR